MWLSLCSAHITITLQSHMQCLPMKLRLCHPHSVVHLHDYQVHWTIAKTMQHAVHMVCIEVTAKKLLALLVGQDE